MAKRDRYFAVCCVSEPAAEVVNEFLTSAYSAEDVVGSLVVITNLEKEYTEPTQPPMDSFTTPFSGKSPSECCKLILDLTAKTKSDLNYQYLAILDERSVEDKTALVVTSSSPDKEPSVFRAEFKIVNLIMGAMGSKGLSGEYKEVADGTSDGVLKF